MAVSPSNVTELDPVWTRIQQEARAAIVAEPLIGGSARSHRSRAADRWHDP